MSAPDATEPPAPGPPAPPAPGRLRRLIGWAAPTVVATALAVVVAGLVEAVLDSSDPLIVATSAGLSMWLAWPVLLGGVLAGRALWRGWRPHQLAGDLREAGGAAPRLWGWLAYLALASLALAFATWWAVRALARITAFKPLAVSLLLPVAVVPCALALVALSRPSVDGLAALVRRADARWAARRGRPLATARAALIGAAVALVAVPVVAWLLLVRPRLGYVDVGVLLHPAVALPVTVLGHGLARRPRLRRPLAAVALVLAGAALAVSVWIRVADPVVLLEVWRRPTVAGEAVDVLVDLEAVRTQLAVSGFPPRARPGAVHPDIILITFDTVRADHTPLLPGGSAAMPHLAALGARGAVFEWAFSPGNVTRRSLPSIATGASPTRVHGRVAGWALRLDPRHVVLSERLRAAGYETAGFFCCDNFFARRRRLGLTRGYSTLMIERDGEVLAAAAHDWLAARGAPGQRPPVFVWMHLIESHNWFEESAELVGASNPQRYDHVLGKVDAYLGTVLAGLDGWPAGRVPLVAVTSDHGEALGEHGQPFHSSDLYNSQIRVPLVIAGPGVVAGRRAEPVGLADLAPTLLDLAGFEPPGLPEMDGRSLADLVSGRRPDDRDGGYAFAAMITDRFVSRPMRTVVRGRWKLIESGDRTELYDLSTDPRELHDLARDPRPPAELARMRALLAERRALDARPAFVTGRH